MAMLRYRHFLINLPFSRGVPAGGGVGFLILINYFMTKKQRAEAALAKLHRNEHIITSYTTGMSVRTIADTLHISQATIFRVLKLNHVETKNNFQFNKATISQAIALYAVPENSINYILQQTGIRSEQTLYRHLHDNGVKLRK